MPITDAAERPSDCPRERGEAYVAQSLRDIFAVQGSNESLDGFSLTPTARDREIVMLLCNRQKPEPVAARYGFDRYAPIRARLSYGGAHRIV